MTEVYPIHAWIEERGDKEGRKVTLGCFDYGTRMFWIESPDDKPWGIEPWGIVFFEEHALWCDASKLFRNWELGSNDKLVLLP